MYAIRNGHEYLTQLTGTGCSVTTTISCFVGANKEDKLMATVAALSFFGSAAEVAVQEGSTKGPASFKVNFHDTLTNMSVKDFVKLVKVDDVSD